MRTKLNASWGRLRRPLVGLAAATSFACQAVVPAGPPPPAFPAAGQPSFALAPSDVEAARVRLSGEQVTDYGNTLVGAASRWAKPNATNPADGPAERSLMALGGPAAGSTWPVAGLDLRQAPFNCAGDRATNGFASRNLFNGQPRRVFLITRNGAFLNLDPANPTVGFTKTELPGETFSRTYVTMAGNGAVAFVVADSGRAYAIDVNAKDTTTNPPSHPRKVVQLQGGRKVVGGALFADPLTSQVNGPSTRLYACDNGGYAHELRFVQTATGFAGATFEEVGTEVQLSVANPLSPVTPLIGTGTERIMSAPVVLNGKLAVGDRGGNLLRYDYKNPGAGVSRRTLNYGWPVETPVAVDVDNNLVPTDWFVGAGTQLFWVKADGTVLTGQYTLLEKGADFGRIDRSTFSNFVSNWSTDLKANAPYTAFSNVKSSASDLGTLPNIAAGPEYTDTGTLSFCEILSGLPPTISAHIGAAGRPYYNYYPWNVAATTTLAMTPTVTPPGTGPANYNSYPVQDGQAIATAQLQSPSAIDFDDDGSTFVADTNHCQLLFNPKDANSWKNWFPAGAMTNAAFSWRAGVTPDAADANNRFYVMAGTLYPHAPNNDGVWSGADDSDSTNATYNGLRRDIGNGAAPPNTAGGSVFTKPAQCSGPGTVARGSAVNRVQGIAVGKLGLYLANRNAFQSGTNDNGQILFLPRANLAPGTYWGITNPQPGRMYVIANFVDPQGLCAWKDPAANRDVVFAPSMTLGAASDSAGRVMRLDSATMTAATTHLSAGVTLASGLNNPYDVNLDDDGNLFIAENGASALRMIARVVPPADGVYDRKWGTAGVAGTLYTIKTGMTDIASVTFAANDPQVPSGCLYIALGAVPTNSAHRIIRMDESTAHQAVAGAAYTTTISTMAPADGGDGQPGDATTVRLGTPWRARGDGNGVTYICDRGNNRIRKLVSSAGSSTATGYLCLPVPATATAPAKPPRGRPIYEATLKLYSKTDTPALTPPEVGLVSPYLKGGSGSGGAMWNNAVLNASPTLIKPREAPDVDLTVGKALALNTSAGLWDFNPSSSTGGTSTPVYEYQLPSQLLFTSASNADFQHLRLGITAPSDANQYYYPTSLGTVASPYVKGPAFYTHTGLTNPDQRPTVRIRYGDYPINYPILSPPTIVYDASFTTRYVYLVNSNALWRFNTTNADAFVDPVNGATVAFTRTSQAQGQATGTLYLNSTFMFNTTPALVTPTNEIFTLDIRATSAVSYSFELAKFKGGLATGVTDMRDTSVTPAVVATGMSGTTSDNAGIYLTAADPWFNEAFFGLADGRVFLMRLR